MKKMSLLLAVMMVFSLVLGACSNQAQLGGNVDTRSEANLAGDAEGGEGAESLAATDEEAFFDPSLFQVKAVDERTLEVNLVSKTPYFLELTAFPVYFPVNMDTVSANGDAWAVDASSYVSNGPYTMTEWVGSSHVTMERNPNYWNAEAIGPQSINFSLIEDNGAELAAFQTGELQFIDNPPQPEIAALKDTPEFQTITQLGTYYVSMNNQAEPFDDPLVRKAFTLAIDRDRLANEIGEGMYQPAGAFVAPNLTDVTTDPDFREVGGDYFDPSAAAYEANLQEARDALTEAGYPDGEGFPVVTYIYNENTLHQNVAEALQAMWAELGVTVELEIQEWATFLETRKNGDYQIARDGWLSDYNDPVSMLDLFITGSGNNNSQYRNTEFDSLITQIKGSGDQAERMTLMHQAEDMLMNDWVVAPIMYYGDPYMLDTSLQNDVWASPLGYKYFMFAQGYDDSTLNVCVGPQPATLDPALNSAADTATILLHLFEGLYYLDRDGVPVPGQAESVDVSEDGLTYTFTLREGIAWQDGTPITAQDFVDSWVRAIDPATAADYAYMFDCIAGYNEALGLAE